MNCSQIKDQTSIVSFLARKGITPVSVNDREYWYKSPFREENTASLKIFADERHWKDHGTGHGGDIIKLVMLMYTINESQALQLLNNQANCDPFPFSTAKSIISGSDTDTVKIDHIQQVQNNALVQYLKGRKIPYQLAVKYIQEAYYSVHCKRYFSIAFKNDAGGYELRNRYFKNCCSPKYITTFTIPGCDSLNLFEGFFDFLSAMVYYNRTQPRCDTIVLNSIANKAHVFLLLQKYNRINLFLDNDQSGEQTARQIIAMHPFVINYSNKIYPNYKDFNEFISTNQ
jgi:DNA primase